MLLIKENEQKNFRFTIEVTGTELRNAEARLVFEDSQSNKFFPLEIKNDGTCEYQLEYADVRALSKGRVYLEVVAEQMLFKPWQDEFRVDTVRASVNESAEIIRKTLQAIGSGAVRTKSTTATPAKKKRRVSESRKSYMPTYDELLAEFKKMMIAKKVSFIMGESAENRLKKKEVIAELYVKYGKSIKPELEQLTRTTIDELLIL
jgi:hypothetical protein